MKLNTNFVHPKDVSTLIQTCQQPFLANIELNVHAYENADIQTDFDHAGVWTNGERLINTWLHRDFKGEVSLHSPPPEKLLR